jgi:hypothetical protein
LLLACQAGQLGHLLSGKAERAFKFLQRPQ